MLVTENDICKVSDLGAAAEFSDADPHMDEFIGALYHELFHLNDIPGSIAYMAPEVILGVPYTKAVDMWSLGVITYCMLSGITPFGTHCDLLCGRHPSDRR